MDVHQVIQHFGGVAPTSRALDISYQAVKEWVDKGQIPLSRQWQLQVLTKGAFKVDREVVNRLRAAAQ
jgi:hypothetical protein